MLIIVYGIPNCGSVQKARTWLATHELAYEFHDFKKAGLSEEIITAWLKVVSWEILVNKKGTTWRALPDATKVSITNAASATQLMLKNPSVIKRPVLCQGKTVLVGFDEAIYQEQLR